ncbi:MAG: peptidase U32 family protein [Candidatus Woesearchaeota archaeon]
MVELLLPAGDELSLRAAIANGADAIYFGTGKFNARRKAKNFSSPKAVISYCHKHDVRAYLAINTLIKNDELPELLGIIREIQPDAFIIQDPCLIPLIRKHSDTPIHMSTQATITAIQGIPQGCNRVILPRELTIEEVKGFSQHIETEVFVHGALCIAYSGQCLFSSIVGGRSGNRGLCAQPCRKKYNNKYTLSTKDLCLLEKLPEIIDAGVTSLKVEGRLRSHQYVGTAARIYRKYIDLHYQGRFRIEQEDLDDLKLAFNREFTKGFMFEDTITNPKNPTNKGLYLGKIKDNRIRIRHDLNPGDGITIWKNETRSGFRFEDKSKKGDIIQLKGQDYSPVYKTSTAEKTSLSEPIPEKEVNIPSVKVQLKRKPNPDSPRIFYRTSKLKDIDKADLIYVPPELYRKASTMHPRVFIQTPRIVSTKEAEELTRQIHKLNPKGVLVSNRAFLSLPFKKHIDYNLNCYNDLDIDCYNSENAIPVISPELNKEELKGLENKNFIVFAHGDIVLMTTKEPLKAPELIDEQGRHFRVSGMDILNNKQLALLDNIQELIRSGIKYFLVEDKVATYQRIIKGEKVPGKGYTLGHFNRGVY